MHIYGNALQCWKLSICLKCLDNTIWYTNSTVLAVRLAIFSQNHGKVKIFPKSVKYHDGSEDKTVKLFHDFKEALHHSIGFLLNIPFASSEFKGPLNLFQSSDGNIPKPCCIYPYLICILFFTTSLAFAFIWNSFLYFSTQNVFFFHKLKILQYVCLVLLVACVRQILFISAPLFFLCLHLLRNIFYHVWHLRRLYFCFVCFITEFYI